jgi:hypothetical protein
MNTLVRLVAPSLLLVLAGCAAGNAEPAVPVPAANFNFQPPSAAQPGSAGMVFVVVAPSWANENQQARSVAEHIFSDLRTAMRDKFIEVLLARGYTTQGDVYTTRDELLYGDKQAADFVIVPELEIDFQFNNLSGGGFPELPIVGYFAVNGSAAIKGRVVLNVYETMSNQRLWTRPITLQERTIRWEGETRHRDITLKDQPNRWPALAVADPGFKRVLVPEINDIFSQVMRTAWDGLDPREFATVKVQADDLKARATTTIR